jgi:hypothetical protein
MKAYGNWSMVTLYSLLAFVLVHALKLVAREGRMRKEEEKGGGEGRGGEGKEFAQAARLLQLLERLNERRERNGGGLVFFLISAEAALPFPCTVAILHSRRG